MKSKQTGFLIVTIVLTLSAGVVAGMLAQRLPIMHAVPAESVEAATGLDDLQLTPAQRNRMRTIWEDVRADVHDCYHDAENLQKHRDEAIVAILDEYQKAEFEKISKEFADKYTRLTERRERSFQSAVAHTRELLDEKQRSKYDQILKSRLAKGVSDDPERQ